MAFIPDEPRLFDYLTVAQHLNFVARLYGVADWRERAQPLLDELEMGDKRKLLPAELSRGMKQKLAIACGLLHQPKIVIFDEPMSGLDPLGRRDVRALILSALLVWGERRVAALVKQILDDHRPDKVLILGDTNSAIATLMVKNRPR